MVNPPSGCCAARPRYLDEPPQPLLPGVSLGFSPSVWSLTASFLTAFFTFLAFLTCFFSSLAGAFSVTSALSLGALPAPAPPPQPLWAAWVGAAIDMPATRPAMPSPATKLLIWSLSMFSPPFHIGIIFPCILPIDIHKSIVNYNLTKYSTCLTWPRLDSINKS